jgi:DNA-binding LacI/PurR family transcriptional regulator
MYQQLRQDLLARIRREEFKPGSVLPSENQLCEDYGVSVTTARRAFLELVKEGVVRRKAGVGTIVATEVRQAQINFVSIDYVGDSWRQYSNIMGEMIGGVSEYAWNHNATLNILGVKDEDAAAYLRRLVEDRSTDGVLLRVANDVREEHVDILEQAGIPYVVIKRRIPGRKMNYVNSDDVAGARMATSYLIDMGHQRIGFVCAKPNVTIGHERQAGYEEALAERGLGLDEELIRTEPYFTQEMGYKAVHSLIELPDPPTALFVASDTMAVGGYEAIQEFGLRIPEDISVVGYDDIALAAALMPPLTTIRTSFYEFGQLSTQLLLELIDNRANVSRTRTIHPRLIVRRSSQEPELRAASPETDSTSKVRLKESEDGHGRLEGMVIAYSGSHSEIDREIKRCCELEGAVVTELSEGETYGRDTAEGLIITLDLREGLGHVLGRALGHGRQALSRTAQGASIKLLILAALHAESTTAGRAEQEAARAGLAQVVRDLSDESAGISTRVNGLLVVRGTESPMYGLARLQGPLSFLISEDSAEVSGQTILVCGRGAVS